MTKTCKKYSKTAGRIVAFRRMGKKMDLGKFKINWNNSILCKKRWVGRRIWNL